VTGVVVRARYRCAGCERDVTALPWAQACLCGGTYRVCVDADEIYYRMPERPNLPRFDPFKDWQVKYLQASWNLSGLERDYHSPVRLPPEAVRATLALALRACVDLADWLLAGPEPHTVTAGAVERLLRTDPLQVAVEFCRPDPDAPRVRLVPVAFAPTARFWVEHARPGEKPVRYDALDLTRRCLDAWRQFLIGCGVAPPRWDG
jgi:hypothetical protein